MVEEQLTSPGAALGTVAYMSPEQVRGEEKDRQEAAGCVLIGNREQKWKSRLECSPMAYAGITVKDPSSIKRFLHRRRLSDAIRVVQTTDPDRIQSIFDFGAADGELCKRLAQIFPARPIFCYEPSPELRQEAIENLKGLNNVAVTSSLAETAGAKFDIVFCLEVLEHLPAPQAADALSAFEEMLGERSIGVIGVPNEIFVPAVMKGAFRMIRRYGRYDARVSPVIRAAVGRPPRDRPIGEIAPGLPYHFEHTGFDYRVLHSVLAQRFEIVSMFGSPFRFLWVCLNSEVYFVVKKRSGSSPAGKHGRQ